MQTKFVLAIAAVALIGFAPVKPDFGLKKGNVWTYQTTTAGKTTEIKETGVRFVEVTPMNWALEIKTEYPGDYESYRYLGQSEDGLLSYYNSQMRGPGVSADVKPAPLLRIPVKKGHTWKWVEPWRGQTAGAVDEKELRKLDQDMSAVIVQEETPIEVPADKHNAVHVRVTAESRAWGKRFEEHWYVTGVGLVKSVYKSNDGESVRVLTKFEPAP